MYLVSIRVNPKRTNTTQKYTLSPIDPSGEPSKLTSKNGTGKEILMASSTKYGEVDIPGIGDKEPVFILRAQDVLATPTIEMYRVLAASHGAPAVGALDKEVERFQVWAGNKKLPD